MNSGRYATAPTVYFNTSTTPGLPRGERDVRGRHDREPFVSGSETSTSYNQYFHSTKDDSDSADDPHLALTSQTLNADGSPKRPMNAFMIFARRRRPQISAANQMMRTGDISKILSKEWSAMDMSEKKFYLDQAKKLKDTFNNKYPDYVYRRRPNNSRKKRKSDPGQNSPPDSLSADVEDSPLEDTSPIDSDDPMHSPSGAGYQYPPPHATGASPSYESSPDFVSPNASVAYSYSSPDLASAPFAQHRTSLSSSADSALAAANINSLRLSPLVDSGTMSHGYSHSVHHPSVYSSQDPRASHSLWESSRDGSRGDPGRSSWPVLPALDINVARQRSSNPSATSTDRTDAYSPQLPNRPWSSTASSTASSSSGASVTQFPNSAFPTLTSAFFPSQSPPQRSAESVPSPTSHQSGLNDYAHSSSAHMQRGMFSVTGRQNGGHEQSSFLHTNILPPPTSSSYVSGAQTLSQWPSHYRATSNSHRMSPSIQSISTLPVQSTSVDGTSPSSSGSGHESASQIGYWERARFDGRS
ncbi:hypothetical protein AcW1_000036 [Taiwanofungus camphoratus]|nr:hypothetical protein AcW2_001469 [Antrodia cinnamomea]KAI0962744.1 hypothetical protein AcW1_000036 [Antrodia cinnamomea]